MTGPVFQAGVVHNVTLNYQTGPVATPASLTGQVPAAGALGAKVPRTREELTKTREAMPNLWEYLLLAGELCVGLKGLESKRFDYNLGHRDSGRVLLDEDGATAHLVGAFSEMQQIVSGAERWLSQDAQHKALGPPGTPGDPELIGHLAGRLLGVYESLIDWAVDLRSERPPAHMLRLFELASLYPRASIKGFESFVETLVEETDRASAALARQDGGVATITVTYVMTIDPDVTKQFEKEKRNVRKGRKGAAWF
ncbi:hypothetical protein J1792_18935 [Streptomyces triculaminicus]|uniref:Uncharacterized protein n=1 Tax=Streptomyces triculaminicus TaxID=2816232 RepID=A0A939FNB6_9ACTN|nr:hypothetical protein [Streptomyces triculaminicus]MBO0654773.1 hypothetical protein [Streptomyces triculaminicus]